MRVFKLIRHLFLGRKAVSDSLAKSAKILTFSRTLGEVVGPGVNPVDEMIRDLRDPERSRRRQQAFEDMLDFVESDEDLSDVIKRHGAGRDDLVKIYRTLELSGGGGWARGHYIPVSTLLLGQTLHYALAMLRTSKEDQDQRNTNLEVAYRLTKYFEDNEMGMIPEAGPLPPSQALPD